VCITRSRVILALQRPRLSHAAVAIETGNLAAPSYLTIIEATRSPVRRTSSMTAVNYSWPPLPKLRSMHISQSPDQRISREDEFYWRRIASRSQLIDFGA